MLRCLIPLLLFLCACAPLREGNNLTLAATLATARAPGTDFRVLSWNVSRQSFYQNSARFLAVLRAIDADIIILDEMPVAPDDAQLRATLLGLGPTTDDWNVVYGSSGGRERSTVSSRHPMVRVAAFDSIRYTESLSTQWLALADPQAHASLLRSLGSGPSLVGAIVNLQGKQLLVVGADLQCCGSGGDSWEESRRRYEASQLRTAILSATTTHPIDAIVVGGDFNAVNGPAPLMLIQGDAKGASALMIADALQLDGVDRWTWDGRGTPFASGVLDHQMHDERLRVVSAWVFDSADLSPAQLRQLKLERWPMSEISQHRPVVVDYAWTDPEKP